MVTQNYVLGIECTAHTFGIAILEYKTKQILVNIKDMFSTEKGGLIPNEVAKHHREIAPQLFEKALTDAKITKEQIKFIALSNAPGLAPCLLEGMRYAKKLSKELNIPIVPVNHCIAHQEIGEITGAKDPVLLYASGANTQIIAYEAGKYRVFGETLDMGIGNFIDTFARHVGLGFPGGPKIQELAKNGKKLIDLGYSIKGMDVAFSGMLTKLQQMFDRKQETLEDLSYSLQETVFAMLTEATERALAHTGKKEVLMGGGVACNSRLQEMVRIMCEERGCKFFCPERQFLVDNAGMIGFLGIKMFNVGIFFKPEDLDELDIKPRERTDQVDVTWR
jgi:N6-L-threonylcarbamoyladenine synthase